MLFNVSQQQQPQQNTGVNNNWKKKSLIIYAISSKSTFIDCVTSFISSTFCCELTRAEMNINKIYTSSYLTLLWSYSDNNFLLFIEHHVTMLLEIHFSIPLLPSTRQTNLHFTKRKVAPLKLLHWQGGKLYVTNRRHGETVQHCLKFCSQHVTLLAPTHCKLVSVICWATLHMN